MCFSAETEVSQIHLYGMVHSMETQNTYYKNEKTPIEKY